MSFEQEGLLPDSLMQINSKKRILLLPWWIKIFMWIFLIIGVILPVVIILGLLGFKIHLALYGFETNQPLSLIGFCLIIIFIIKSATSFGMIKGKKWAVKAGIIDSIVGIAICLCLMAYSMIGLQDKFSLRIELVLLIPYLRSLIKIRSEWENTSGSFTST
jgi:hypothetical protein